MTWESLLDKLAQVWDKIIDAVQVWLDTAPAYIQDLVTRYTHLQITKGIILSSCWFMIMSGLITLSIYLIRRAINKEDRYNEYFSTDLRRETLIAMIIKEIGVSGIYKKL